MPSPGNLLSYMFRGLRSRLLLLVVLACLPLVILTLNTALDESRRARQTWNDEAERLARFAEREELSIVSSTRQFLAALAESTPVRTRTDRDAQKVLEN